MKNALTLTSVWLNNTTIAPICRLLLYYNNKKYNFIILLCEVNMMIYDE